jgi:rubrerythrin
MSPPPGRPIPDRRPRTAPLTTERPRVSTTPENLAEAFAGESQANQKYRAFAKQAEHDGFPNVARLFRTAAEAERIHAEGHLRAMDGVASTVQNLQAAIAGETYEFTAMYPPMLRQAEQDGHKAKRMFGYAVQAEDVHARLYALALEAVLSGADLAEAEFYLCPVCGHIEFGKPPESCPICGAKAAKFTKVCPTADGWRPLPPFDPRRRLRYVLRPCYCASFSPKT